MSGDGEINVWTCDQEDVGTQKCRLGPSLMDKLRLKIDSCVQITYQDRVYVCKAWPRIDGWNHAIQFDKTACIFKPDTSLQATHSTCKSKCHSNSIQQTDTVKLSGVEVSLVFANLSDVLRFHKMESKSQGYVQVKRNVTDILKRFYVLEDMRLKCLDNPLGKLYGIAYILILKTKSFLKEHVCGTVSSQTSVTVTSAMSHERYELLQDRKPISLGGLYLQVKNLREILSYAKSETKLAEQLGISWPVGVFIHGPPGSGKTSLVRKCVSEEGLTLLEARGSEILGSRPGEGEEQLRKLFKKAIAFGEEAPCAVLIEDLESICPNRTKGNRGNTQERRMVAQFSSLLDTLNNCSHVFVIATSSKPQLVDATVLTTGRLEKEISIGIPSCTQRKSILDVLLSGFPLDEDVDLNHIAEASPGFVSADLKSMVDQAHYLAATDSMSAFKIKSKHLLKSLHSIVPSCQRGSDVIVDHQPVSWSHVGGLKDVIKQLKQAVEWPLKHSSAFSRLGIPRPGGLLLYGPPGCAKTLLVRAAASACGVTFLALSGAQLNSPFVGDAERKLTDVFRQARENAPSILFLDEVDAVVGKRKEGTAHGGAHERVLSTLLNEMDGVGLRLDELVKTFPDKLLLEQQSSSANESKVNVSETEVDNSGVLVVAATNRPDLIDAALMRPGRFDKIIYVPPPDEQARSQILEVHSRRMPCAEVDLVELSRATHGFTGADLENLCREAALNALTREGLDAASVRTEDFTAVLAKMKPSLTSQDLEFYANLMSKNQH